MVRTSESDLLLPTDTLPKLRLVGFTASCPAATPVPDIATLTGWLPDTVTEMLPLAAPPAIGANVTLTDEL